MMAAPPHRNRLLALAAISVLAVVGAGCGGDDDGGDDPAPSADAGTVQVDDNVFEPEEIEVKAGDTVTWEFVGGAQHNVSGSGFESENMKSGTFEHTFESAGEFDYVCTLHPGMKGTVTVARG